MLSIQFFSTRWAEFIYMMIVKMFPAMRFPWAAASTMRKEGTTQGDFENVELFTDYVQYFTIHRSTNHLSIQNWQPKFRRLTPGRKHVQRFTCISSTNHKTPLFKVRLQHTSITRPLVAQLPLMSTTPCFTVFSAPELTLSRPRSEGSFDRWCR